MECFIVWWNCSLFILSKYRQESSFRKYSVCMYTDSTAACAQTSKDRQIEVCSICLCAWVSVLGDAQTEIYSTEGGKGKIAAGVCCYFRFFHTEVAGSRSPTVFIVHPHTPAGVTAVFGGFLAQQSFHTRLSQVRVHESTHTCAFLDLIYKLGKKGWNLEKIPELSCRQTFSSTPVNGHVYAIITVSADCLNP